MSEILYMKISTQNIACSQRQMHTCVHHSVIHYEREGGRETDRQTDRQNDRQRQTKNQTVCKPLNHKTEKS